MIALLGNGTLWVPGGLRAARPTVQRCVGKITDHLRDYRRSNEPGGANGVTITAAVKARHCQRALPA